jgi:hypothetical protein
MLFTLAGPKSTIRCRLLDSLFHPGDEEAGIAFTLNPEDPERLLVSLWKLQAQIIKRIFDYVKNDWKKKIIASGVILSILTASPTISSFDTGQLKALSIIAPLSFISGCVVAIYLLIGTDLNREEGHILSGKSKVTKRVAKILYAISLIPLIGIGLF